jgi:hypothetical protein
MGIDVGDRLKVRSRHGLITSALDPDPDWIRFLIRNLYPDPGYRRAKMTHKNRKCHVLKSGCSLLRAEGFSVYSWDVLYGVLGISKLQF